MHSLRHKPKGSVKLPNKVAMRTSGYETDQLLQGIGVSTKCLEIPPVAHYFAKCSAIFLDGHRPISRYDFFRNGVGTWVRLRKTFAGLVDHQKDIFW